VRPLVVELLEKIVKLGLLLQTVHARGTSGFSFEREMVCEQSFALQHGSEFTLEARPWRTILSLAFEASNFLVLAPRSNCQEEFFLEVKRRDTTRPRTSVRIRHFVGVDAIPLNANFWARLPSLSSAV
jgi:hypothetical protein